MKKIIYKWLSSKIHFVKKINIGFVLIISLLIIALIVNSINIFKKISSSNKTSISQIKTNNSAETTTTKPPMIEKYYTPILMYHYIRDASGESDLGKKLSVLPTNFDDQLQWLEDNGYEGILASDLADPKRNEMSKVINDKKKPIVLTFDDGYKDAYTDAFPILKKHHFVATFYIIRDYVGYPAYLDQSQIENLKAAGNEIGSHTLSHPDLATLTEQDQTRQIFNSKNDATSFCYPSGKYSDLTLKLVKSAGYLTAVTTHPGIANQSSDLYTLPRVRVDDGSGVSLGRKIASEYENAQ